MAGEQLSARLSLHRQLWFRWTGKCFETATSHMQTVVCNLNTVLIEKNDMKENEPQFEYKTDIIQKWHLIIGVFLLIFLIPAGFYF